MKPNIKDVTKFENYKKVGDKYYKKFDTSETIEGEKMPAFKISDVTDIDEIIRNKEKDIEAMKKTESSDMNIEKPKESILDEEW